MRDDLALIESVLKGYPDSFAKSDAMNAVKRLQSQQDGAQGGEAVAWQYRMQVDGGAFWGDWTQVESEEQAQRIVASCIAHGYTAESRALYSRPAIAPQATPAAVDDAILRYLLAVAVAGLEGAINAAGGNPGPHTAHIIAASKAALAAPPAEVKP